jgi:exosortase
MNIQSKLRLQYVAAALALIACLPFFKALARVSTTHPYAGHVVFVPVLGGALLWFERQRLRDLRGRGNLGGIAVVTLALVLLGIGYGAESVPLQALSCVVTLAGLGYWRYGADGIRSAGFTLAFLLLMVPPPRQAISALSPGIQQFVAAFSSVFIESFGIPVEQQGVFLLLPGLTLEVAEECSGLRFLLILLVFVTAFARAVLPTTSSRLTLVAMSIPVAVLANAFRVAVTSAGAHAIGPHVIAGPLHYYIGKAFWALALAAMIGIAWVLRAETGSVVADGRRRRGATTADAR